MTIIGSAIKLLLPLIMLVTPVLVGIGIDKSIDRYVYWQDVKKYGKEEADEIYRRWK